MWSEFLGQVVRILSHLPIAVHIVGDVFPTQTISSDYFDLHELDSTEATSAQLDGTPERTLATFFVASDTVFRYLEDVIHERCSLRGLRSPDRIGRKKRASR